MSPRAVFKVRLRRERGEGAHRYKMMECMYRYSCLTIRLRTDIWLVKVNFGERGVARGFQGQCNAGRYLLCFFGGWVGVWAGRSDEHLSLWEQEHARTRLGISRFREHLPKFLKVCLANRLRL
jgi:hypothetical protein